MTNPVVLYHCFSARSFRVLWALEELGVPYTLKLLPFPPRYLARDYLQINPLGTIPFFIDGETQMTESSAICHYLARRHSPSSLAVAADEPAYGAFLNWQYFADATLTVPQTLVLRYSQLEPLERRQPDVVDAYAKWFIGRLKAVEIALEHSAYLCANRFTVADISVGYAFMLTKYTGLDGHLPPSIVAYWDRLVQRPACQRALAIEQQAAKDAGIATASPSAQKIELRPRTAS